MVTAKSRQGAATRMEIRSFQVVIDEHGVEAERPSQCRHPPAALSARRAPACGAPLSWVGIRCRSSLNKACSSYNGSGAVLVLAELRNAKYKEGVSTSVHGLVYADDYVITQVRQRDEKRRVGSRQPW